MKIVKRIDVKIAVFIIIPMMITLYCFNKNFTNTSIYETIDLWILPLLYFICEIITYREIKKSERTGAWAISIVGFLRYVVTIFLYYLDIENNYTYFMNSKNLVVGIMSFEMICIYTFIYFYSKYNQKKIQEDETQFSKNNYSFGNLTIAVCILAYIVILLRYPGTVFKSQTENVETGVINSIIILISNFANIIITLLLLRIIKNFKINTISKIIVSLIISIIFSLSLSISDESVSRWTMVINLIIFISITKKYYINYNKFINSLLLISLCILIVFATALKFR